ncbi:hypothetical protein BDD12DRAFT_867157, partial [Trichophaea hybrida]
MVMKIETEFNVVQMELEEDARQCLGKTLTGWRLEMFLQGHEQSDEHGDDDERYDKRIKRRLRCCMLGYWI